MNNFEFNEKWSKYIPDRNLGMEFGNEEIINICDEYFEEIIKLFPYLEIYQIKPKYNSSRVYTNMNLCEEDILEKDIDIIMKRNRNEL